MANPKPKLEEGLRNAATGEVVAAQVYLPPEINGKETKEVTIVRQDISVKDNIVRIIHEADPIGFLIAVQRGALFETHIVNAKGEIMTIYEQPGMKMRVLAAKYLAERVMPKLSVVRHIDDPGKGGGGSQGNSGGRSWAQIVEQAAQDDGSSD